MAAEGANITVSVGMPIATIMDPSGRVYVRLFTGAVAAVTVYDASTPPDLSDDWMDDDWLDWIGDRSGTVTEEG